MRKLKMLLLSSLIVMAFVLSSTQVNAVYVPSPEIKAKVANMTPAERQTMIDDFVKKGDDFNKR